MLEKRDRVVTKTGKNACPGEATIPARRDRQPATKVNGTMCWGVMWIV